MRVTVDESGQTISYLKGAPEVLLQRSNLSEVEKKQWFDKSEQYASQGFRILALAWGETDSEQNLHFIGLILLGDPPRKEVAGAISQAKKAGIRVLMITGDHPATALSIAQQIGIEDKDSTGHVVTGEQLQNISIKQLTKLVAKTNVFARVKPEHKLAIVKALRELDQTIAVTGDGVNDAPALKAADVGVAMGIRGSDVSREVADLVLMDDNFSTIVDAIEEGRNIFENIKKFIRFMFAANLAEVLLVAIGVIISMMADYRYESGALLLPLTAVQILWINLLTDSFPALALALDKNIGVMNCKPIPRNSPILDQLSSRFILAIGGLGGGISLGLLYTLPGFGIDLQSTQTLVFTYLTVGQLLFVFPARKLLTSAENNHYLYLAIILGIVIQLCALILPGISNILGVTALDFELFMMISLLCFISWLAGETIGKMLRVQQYTLPTIKD